MSPLYSDVCEQNMRPVNEMMIPPALTASEMIFAGIPRYDGMTVTFSLLKFNVRL